MKRIILFALCLLLGILALTGCSGNSEPFYEKDYTADGGEIKEVHIDVRDRCIEVALSEDNNIHIQYAENTKEYYNISVSDNVLTMKAESSKDWTDYVGGKGGPGSRTILLQLPDGLLSVLNLSTTNEDISIASATVTGDVSLFSNGGNITFENLNVGNTITLDVKNGDISGSIIGSYDDYSILCTIKKGECNLPTGKQNGKKTLNVSANNGDVAVEFVSESQ